MTERERAIRHVAALIVAYRAMSARGSRWAGSRVTDLTREIATMQTRGPEGDRLAREWCVIGGA